MSDLAEIWRREHRARTEEWLDNITKVCLGMYQLSEEERQIVQALEEKYECLRYVQAVTLYFEVPRGHLYSKVDIMLEYKSTEEGGFSRRGTYRAGRV